MVDSSWFICSKDMNSKTYDKRIRNWLLNSETFYLRVILDEFAFEK
jgi:hypothetical protein